MVVDWVTVVLEMYGQVAQESPVLNEMVVALRNKVREEVHKAEEAQRIEGMLQLLTN